MGTASWKEAYRKKRESADNAVKRIRPGQRVFIGSSCGEPRHLVRAFFLATRGMTDVEVVRLFSMETKPLAWVADASDDRLINIRSFYMGSGSDGIPSRYLRFFTPGHLSLIPHLFLSRKLPIHAALVQVSEPDRLGWMNLGVSVDITLAAAMSADLMIVQVNRRMPRVRGRGAIHVDDADIIVEHDEKPLTLQPTPVSDTATRIAGHAQRIIEDGSTLHVSPGALTHALLLALTGKNDLGIHTQHITDGMMVLAEAGVITNRKKGINDGKCIAGGAMGSERLYDYIRDNPTVEFHPSDYVNDPSVIARHHRMVSVNAGSRIDLTGQVAADAGPDSHFSGITGMVDFFRGAACSRGGKAILLIPSTECQGEKSRIVPLLRDTPVVVGRADVQYVATEFGMVNLLGKSLQERALALISIAHPDYREILFEQAKELGFLGSARTLRETIRGIYPQRLEETVELDGETIFIRPAKPEDERRIQEHYYRLEPLDVSLRFFNIRKCFYRQDVEQISQIDYIGRMALVAVVGEMGFGEIVAIGEYCLERTGNMAEISFSVSKPYQNRGLGRALMRKLAQAARENGIAGFRAVVLPENMKMTRLFKALPYPIQTAFSEGTVVLSCRFDEIE